MTNAALPRRARFSPAYVVLLLVLLLTAFSTWFVQQLVVGQQRTQFLREVDTATLQIQERLDGYVQVMRSTRGLWSMYANVSRDDFARFVDALELERNYPGIQGLGFAQYVRPASQEAFEQQLRREGALNFAIRPGAPFDFAVPVTYLEPRDSANQYALGYDMASERARRAAIEQARDTGDVSATGRVTLVQEDRKQAPQNGFLIYIPIYRDNFSLRTLAERRAAILGFVYAPFRVGDFLNAALGVRSNSLRVTVRDPSGTLFGAVPNNVTFGADRSVAIAGRTWNLAFSAPSGFGRGPLSLTPWFILVLGFLIALFAFIGTQTQVSARRRAEELSVRLARSRESLDKSRAEFESIFRAMHDAAILADASGRVRLSNDASVRTFGYSSGELQGQPVRRLYAEDPGDFDAAESVSASFERKDGTRFVGELQRSEVRGMGGELLGQLEVVRDMTERLAAERAVRESETRYRSLVEGMPQIVWLAGPDGRVTYFNRRWDEYVGPQRAPQGFAPDVLHPDDREAFRVNWERAVSTRRPFEGEYRLRSVGGEYRTFMARATSVLSPEGGVLEWIGILTDVEDEVYAEAAASLLADVSRLLARPLGETRDVSEILRLLVERMFESASLWTLDGGEYAMTRAAKPHVNLEGVERSMASTEAFVERVLTTGQSEVWPQDDLLLELGLGGAVALPLVARGERPFGVLLLGVRGTPDDRDLELAHEIAARLATALDNERLFVQAREAERAVKDLNATLEARVEQRTRELQEANRELEAFSYSVSHDLRTPLRHVVGFGDLLTKEAESQLGPKGKRYLGIMVDAATRMSALIDDLLNFSRMGRTEMRAAPVRLDKVLAEARAELAPDLAERRVTWDVESLPTVVGDGNLLKLVFTNLFSNALKYSRGREESVIRVRWYEENDEAVISISDNGVGFDERFADKLFGVFQRLHRAEEFEGTGIGLANVRRIVTRHGGRVWAESRLGEGATFYFSLPLERQPQEGTMNS
ncbi:CHASE domain-containing protein [Deinococcus yavapaiensis]|uniref:histidine kinase n=1 Tax=Deinococcus yavapaiensis KR-236 TaxID=694435 RepID=A0A318STR7_9DEIO|nr:CHASE domain-containing protein [Deinococcus yavapaiensis]PYE56626.1 PAS domain S-box-containing protein [Deinococcus yavapaiensis KR-236]